MDCMIVDDDEMSRAAIRGLIAQDDQLSLVKECTNPLEAIEFLKKGNADLLFLDIEMPGMSGIDLIRNFQISPQVILTTSHKEYALDAFEFNVVDYLVKPVDPLRFKKAVARAKEHLERSKTRLESVGTDHFFIKKNAVLYRVALKDIQFIEALGDYVTIHTADNKFVLHLTLKALEAKLPSDKFIRVHRSFIVNYDNISSVEDTMISIDKKLIPIGAIYRDNFVRRLNLL